MTLILTCVVKVILLSNIPKVLDVGRYLLKSYRQKQFYEFHIIFGHHVQ